MYKVFTKRLASILCQLGFKIVKTEVNNQKPWLLVYLFEDTPELREAVALHKGEGSQWKM